MEQRDCKFLNENKIIQKSQKRFKRDKHDISITKANKIAFKYQLW